MPNERRQRSDRDRRSAARAQSGGSPSLTDDQVRDRAYELSEARGRENGHDLDDWLQAERELCGHTKEEHL
jgi:hypothetical protein